MRVRLPSLISLVVSLVLLLALMPGEAGYTKAQEPPPPVRHPQELPYSPEGLSSQDGPGFYPRRSPESLRFLPGGARLFIPGTNDPGSDSLIYSSYLPVVRYDVDLTITGLEATQAVQTATNSVPLVENRQTIVRIFAQTTSPGGTQGVTISVAATRNGVPLPGSPLMLGPYTVPHSPSRGVYTSTMNVLLPQTWLSGAISLTATVDATNAIHEANETNNTASTMLSFNYVPPLNVKFVPIDYTWSVNGTFCAGPTSQSISYWLMHTYPVHEVQTSFRAPLPFTGDLSQPNTEWSRLANALRSVKQADGAPESQVYYGLLDSHNNACPLAWGGVGYIGLRVSVGQHMSYTTLAHEIGHNFGRLHAPCGNPGGVDPNYPYPDGSIGEYGVDVFDGRVWTPGPPDNTKDVMSYCWPKWFSDYTYQGLYEDQLVHGWPLGPKRSARVLLVRATVMDDGLVLMEPTYPLEGVPTRETEPGDLTVELLDAGGRILVSHAARLYEVEDADAHTRSLSVLVQSPDAPVASVRIVKEGRVVAERRLDSPGVRAAAAPLLTLSSGSIVLSWGAPDMPALVRYAADEGQSWTTVGIDVRGGQLLIDTGQLPGGKGRFEIRLGDTSVPFVLEPPTAVMLPDAPSSAQISGPTVLAFGQLLLLIGEAMDREDGPITELHWSVDGKDAKAGQMLQVTGLAPGEHTIVLTVRDRSGQLGRAEHRVTVRDVDAVETSGAEQPK